MCMMWSSSGESYPEDKATYTVTYAPTHVLMALGGTGTTIYDTCSLLSPPHPRGLARPTNVVLRSSMVVQYYRYYLLVRKDIFLQGRIILLLSSIIYGDDNNYGMKMA